jgi:hypothetical protein
LSEIGSDYHLLSAANGSILVPRFSTPIKTKKTKSKGTNMSTTKTTTDARQCVGIIWHRPTQTVQGHFQFSSEKAARQWIRKLTLSEPESATVTRRRDGMMIMRRVSHNKVSHFSTT